jgi:hypothetical protein
LALPFAVAITPGGVVAATFAHDESGIVSLCRAMVRREVEVVAIERLDGVLVERLLETGLRVPSPGRPQLWWDSSVERIRGSRGRLAR